MSAATASPLVASGDVAAVARGLLAAVDDLVSVPHDELGEDQIRTAMAADERAIRRLQAHQAGLSATLTRRRAAAARRERPDDVRAPEKAAQQVRREMAEGMGITPSQAKQTTRTGRALEDLPAARDAFAAGELTAGHVRVIAEVTAHFRGDERDEFEAELVRLAQDCRDAVEFGRAARGQLIARDHDAAMADLQRRKARRSARVAQTEDGTTRLVLETAGYAGELVHTAIDAFRRPDAAGEHRNAEQRTHDAITAAFEAALRAGDAPTQHGVRPHVSLVFRAESVRPRTGAAATTTWTGPLPYREVAHLLGDCSLARLVADADDVPLSVTRKVRTVPMGLWRDLLVRDGGCIWPGCDVPAGWCQVAHLEDPYVDDGRLSPDTAGLLCSSGANHHARYDQGGYGVAWTAGRPQVLTSDGRPVADQRSGRWDDPSTTPPLLFARESRGRYCTARPRRANAPP